MVVVNMASKYLQDFVKPSDFVVTGCRVLTAKFFMVN